MDLPVGGGVVAAVGLRPGAWAEAAGVDAEAVQVVELVGLAGEITAHVVAPAWALDRAAGRGRVEVEAPRAPGLRVFVRTAVALGLRVPRQREDRVVVADVARLGIVLPVAVPEAVREDL